MAVLCSAGAGGSSLGEVDSGTDLLQIIVSQVSSNSITISWYLYGLGRHLSRQQM